MLQKLHIINICSGRKIEVLNQLHTLVQLLNKTNDDGGVGGDHNNDENIF